MQPFLQSAIWAEFLQTAGTPCQRLDGLLYRHVKQGPFRYSTCSRFLLPSPSLNLPENGDAFVRFEPEDAASFQNLEKHARQTKRALKSAVAMQPRQTLVLDISQPWENVLADMKQKHRYNIKLAERKGVRTEIFSTWDEAAFQRFWQLHAETARRQGFRTHPEPYYRAMLATLMEKGAAHLAFCSYEEEDLATMLLITHEGTATYLHGGSSESRRNLMAPYLLHAAAIRFSQEKKCVSYDFWGIDAVSDPETGQWTERADKGSAGTTRFKLGFGGAVVAYPGTYDLVLRPFWYNLYMFIKKIRGNRNDFS